MVRAVIFLLVLSGCSTHSQSEGSMYVHIDGGSGAAAVLGIGLFAVGIYGYEKARMPPAVLPPDRAVNEQDCTKPVELSGGNLRCK